MTDPAPAKKQYTLAEMKLRSKQSRMQFLQDLQNVPKMKPTKVILLVGWSLAMSSLDATIVNIALPNIQVDENFVPDGQVIPQSVLQWIVDIYSIAYASFAIPAAKIGDRFGQTLVHRCGVAAFTVFSVLCGVAKYIKYTQTPWQYGGLIILIAGRFLQGVAGAFNMANSMCLSALLVEQKDVAKSMALNALAFSLATTLGPVIGGLFTTYIGWEYCFFINIILGGASITVCWIYLPKTPKFKEDKMDIAGGIFVLLGLVQLIMGFTFIPPDRNALGLGITLVLTGAITLVAFVFWEWYHPFAILPRALLTNKRVMLSQLADLFNFLMLTTVSFQNPFILQTMHCLTPLVAGCLSLVNPVAQIIASLSMQKLSKKVTSLMIKSVASGIAVAFVITLGFIVPYHVAGIVIIGFFFSMALGMFYVSNNQYMMQSASADIRGMLSGCIYTFKETGYAIGVALVNLIQDVYMGSNWKGRVPIDHTCSDPLFNQYRTIYYWGVCFTDIGMAAVGVITMIFGIMAGTNTFEKGFIGYPKDKDNTEYTKVGEAPQVVNDNTVEPEDKEKEPLIEEHKE